VANGGHRVKRNPLSVIRNYLAMNDFFAFTRKHYGLIVAVAFAAGGAAGALFGVAGATMADNLQNFFAERGLTVRWLDSRSSPAPSAAVPEAAIQKVVEEESAVIKVVENVNPAVVSIAISKDLSQYPGAGPNLLPFDDFFGFGLPFPAPSRPTPPAPGSQNNLQRIGGGSGFIIEPDGLIVTNRHVVADESAVYTVILSDGQEYAAEIVARDPVLDVALVRIGAQNLPTVRLGDSDNLRIGQTVIAIGYALAEYGNTVTKGVVSGSGRRVIAGDGLGSSEVIEEAIQTDAAINPGNSGGPLINIRGEVIGINTAVSGEGQLVGFAIPVNNARQTIESVRQHGRIIRPWLGVRYVPVTARLAEQNRLPVSYGALVSRGAEPGVLAVMPGSPADKAGLAENDLILEINGKKLENKDSLGKEIARYEVGQEISLKVLHQGQEKILSVKLEEFPANP